MTINLKNRNFLKLLDYTPAEIQHLIDLAITLKADKKAGREKKTLVGKNIALIFEKTSTRTRCAFEVGAFDQGAQVTYLGPSGSQIGHKESMKDTARACWVVCMTASNTAVMGRISSRSWASMLACRSGTG